MIQTWTHEGDKLMASLMNHKSAHLTLIALLPKPPEQLAIDEFITYDIYILSSYSGSVSCFTAGAIYNDFILPVINEMKV